MNETEKPYSYHVFLFPFSWDVYKDSFSGASNSFKTRTDIIAFDALLNESIWQKLDFSKDPVNYYNDYAFFHTAVREAIFGKTDGESQIVRNYERKNIKGGSYEIKVKKRSETYRLELEQIRLNTYDTGIAILSFYCANYGYPDWKQILEINDFGRRIYPQFLDTASKDTGGDLLEQVRGAFLAERIQVIDATGRLIFSEDFSYIAQSLNFVVNQPQEWSFLSEKMVCGILGSQDFTTQRRYESKEQYAYIEPILDDRMFVACWYGNDYESKQLKSVFHEPSKTDMWMQYVFVDNNGSSCQSEPMQRELLQKHTYHRWANYGTLYGVTRYSLVVLTDQTPFASGHLKDHLKGRYLELAQLSLAQRASCQRFSHEINNLASLDDDKAMKREAEFIHREYLRFVNKLYFLEATPQEQGIELFTMLQESMRVKSEIDFLNTELTDLYEFLSLREADEQSKAANQFAWVATVFLPASLIAAIFGFSTIDKETNFLEWPSCLSFWGPLLITVAAIVVALKVLSRANKGRIVHHQRK